jgi:hypothetical protein
LQIHSIFPTRLVKMLHSPACGTEGAGRAESHLEGSVEEVASGSKRQESGEAGAPDPQEASHVV